MISGSDTGEYARQKFTFKNFRRSNVSLVAAMFFLSRIAFYLAGVRMWFGGLPGDPQLLGVHQLRIHPFLSIFNLHSQPPLFNAYTAFLLRFPRTIQYAIGTETAWLLGLILVLSAFNLLLELEIPRHIAITVVVVLLANPAIALYENWYYFTFTTAALLTFGAYALVRFLRHRSRWWGSAYCISLALVVLTNSTFQWPWMLAVIVPVAVSLRSDWKTLVQVTLLPIVVVSGWYAKDVIMFHTFSTSSWLGMNMTHTTTDALSKTSLRQMIAKGELTKIVLVPAFSPVDSYVPGLIPAHSKAGARVLNSKTEDGMYTNYNNINFIAISNAYLANDLRFVVQRPVTYLSSVSKAVQLFVAPADEYGAAATDEARINTYTSWFDKIVMLQPGHADPTRYSIQSGYSFGGTGIRTSWAQESYAEILVLLTTLFALPYLLWRRRFHGAQFWVLSFIFVSTAYTFLVTNLLELGENNRFQMDLGPLPMIAAVVVFCQVYAAWKQRHRSTGNTITEAVSHQRDILPYHRVMNPTFSRERRMFNVGVDRA
ncbi:MAG TPA: hypothetical protein VMU99_01250 [Acidimicrobiales bacterium]|nr:hypothetical protein [Acidimicrobiales bacterium]